MHTCTIMAQACFTAVHAIALLSGGLCGLLSRPDTLLEGVFTVARCTAKVQAPGLLHRNRAAAPSGQAEVGIVFTANSHESIEHGITN